MPERFRFYHCITFLIEWTQENPLGGKTGRQNGEKDNSHCAFFSSDNIHATVLFRSPVRYKMDHIAACNYNNVHNLLASSSAGQEQYFLSLLEFQQDMYTMNLVSVQQWTRQIVRERALVPSFQSNFQNTWLFIFR